MKQAQCWHWDQLLDLRQWQKDTSLIPMTHPLTMISDAALGVVSNENTVMAIPPLSQTLCLTSLLESQCGDPFQLTVWHNLTSVVCRPWCWQVNSLMLLTKMVKIPLRFRHPTTMETSSRVSSPRAWHQSGHCC
jgi:hypothetical protein